MISDRIQKNFFYPGSLIEEVKSLLSFQNVRSISVHSRDKASAVQSRTSGDRRLSVFIGEQTINIKVICYNV